MTSLDPGPAAEMGAYVKRSMLGNAIHSAVTGLKNPTRNPGPMSQLGGEFVFTTTRKCIYACRMTTTRDHGDLVSRFFPRQVSQQMTHRPRSATCSPLQALMSGERRASRTNWIFCEDVVPFPFPFRSPCCCDSPFIIDDGNTINAECWTVASESR